MSRSDNQRDPDMLTMRLRKLADDLYRWSWRRTLPITELEVAPLTGPPAYGELAPPADAVFQPASLPLPWPGENRYMWIRLTVRCPDWPAGDGALFLRGRVGGKGWNATNAQAIVMVDGRAAGAFDTAHHFVRLADGPKSGQMFGAQVLLWTGMEAHPQAADILELIQLDPAVEEFALDLETAVRTAAKLGIDDERYQPMMNACHAAAALVDTSLPIGDAFYESARRAHAAWRSAMDEIELPARFRPVATLVGQGHLDLGWLWPVQASHFKALNTVINQLNLADEFPEHVFLWSQPQSWKWIAHDHPATWDRIRRKVKSGNWDASGGMWVEADTNIPCGESLVRQMLYGTRFVREQLGYDETLLWLPDVFGYTAALPQLLRQFGIPHFMTTKISWNEYNELPWETFHWHGLDGSSVLTHFGTCRTGGGSYITYNVELTPEVLIDGWRAFRSKADSRKFVVAFGYGDGGGGPSRREIQYGQRLGRMPGQPAVRQQTARQFFVDLAKEVENVQSPLPAWHGELYMEGHRGVYTTEGRTKRNNRLCENMLHDAELLASLALPLGGVWDKATLDECWELLLLNQFHDILPGSSIHEVYELLATQHADILRRAGAVRQEAARLIAAKIDTSAFSRPIVLFNTADTARHDPVELPADTLVAGPVAIRFADRVARPVQAGSDPDGRAYCLAETADVPPLGWAVADVIPAPDPAGAVDNAMTVTESLLENRFWRIELDGRGRISRLFDRIAGREVLAPGRDGFALGNQLQLFRDRPVQWDAWNVDYHDTRQPPRLLEATSVEVIERGPVRAAVRCHYHSLAGGQSTLVQDIRIHRSIERIDFATWVDWRECDTILKAAFPVAVHAPNATYEIQFGSIARPTHRNTSWDVARFEVPAQRWIDLGEWGYGVSLLNDCKYGHDVLGNVMRLSLLRGPKRPDGARSDQGEHRFTYSLLPHAGDWRDRTLAGAAELNLPLVAVPAETHGGPLAAQHSLVQAEPASFVITAVKKAEDDDRLIVRGYEAHGARGQVTLRFGSPVRSVWKSQADERTEESLKVSDLSVTFDVRPFEIVTLKVRP